jgi:hypothetical protein
LIRPVFIPHRSDPAKIQEGAEVEQGPRCATPNVFFLTLLFDAVGPHRVPQKLFGVGGQFLYWPIPKCANSTAEPLQSPKSNCALTSPEVEWGWVRLRADGRVAQVGEGPRPLGLPYLPAGTTGMPHAHA